MACGIADNPPLKLLQSDLRAYAMTCKMTENPPLEQLQAALGLKEKCHSRRAVCIRGMESPGKGLLAARGAGFGCCQGLFEVTTEPSKHTERVKDFLKKAGAPWPNSQEICLNLRNGMGIKQYLIDTTAPLELNGRVPVVITNLNPGIDTHMDEINAIMATKLNIAPGETILVRVVPDGKKAMDAIARKMEEIVASAWQEGKMPAWWPLIQFKWTETWRDLRESLGEELWRYTNIAINPLRPTGTSSYFPPKIKKQLVVAQIPLGLAEGVNEKTGEITVSAGAYNLFDYFRQLGEELEAAPTGIFLGQSQPECELRPRSARHLLRPGDRQRRADRGRGQGARLRRAGRFVPLRRAGRAQDGRRNRRIREDRRRQEVRRSAGRAHHRATRQQSSSPKRCWRFGWSAPSKSSSRRSTHIPRCRRPSAKRRTPCMARRFTLAALGQSSRDHTMSTPVVMPQMGESIAEGTIVRWIKKIGDSVDRDEPLFEISTDKVDAEIPVTCRRDAARDQGQGRRDGRGQQRRCDDRRGGRKRPPRRHAGDGPRAPRPRSRRLDGAAAPPQPAARRRCRQSRAAARAPRETPVPKPRRLGRGTTRRAGCPPEILSPGSPYRRRARRRHRHIAGSGIAGASPRTTSWLHRTAASRPARRGQRRRPVPSAAPAPGRHPSAPRCTCVESSRCRSCERRSPSTWCSAAARRLTCIRFSK